MSQYLMPKTRMGSRMKILGKTPQSGIFESMKKENGIKDDVSF
jgi:hypothetical protein